MFSPFDLETLRVRYDGRDHGPAVPHRITRHTHPKARPETPEPATTPRTGIDYLALVAQDHQQQISADQKINYHALYPGELPGPLSIDDATAKMLAERSRELGAVGHHLVDARPAYFEQVIKYLIMGNVRRGNLYPLCVGAERVLQAQTVAQFARQHRWFPR